MTSAPGVWKHIGLHGHSVGTFACDEKGIKWTSALFGKDDAAMISSTRNIPKDAIMHAQWSIFGKSGHLRVKTQPNSKLHHELRFDGFPAQDFETLKDLFKDNYSVDLAKLSMNAAGTQFGLSKMSGKKLTFNHCILEDADEEGEVRDDGFNSVPCMVQRVFCSCFALLCSALLCSWTCELIMAISFSFRSLKFGRATK